MWEDHGTIGHANPADKKSERDGNLLDPACHSKGGETDSPFRRNLGYAKP